MKAYQLLTLLTMLTTSSISLAVAGNPADFHQGGPESLCRILIRNEQNALTSICSGTLVTPTKILTAQHCTPEPNEHLIAECGFQSVDNDNLKTEITLKGSRIYTDGVKFKESAKAQVAFTYEKQDQAVFELDHALSIKPMPLKVDRKVGQDTTCVVSGFGRSNSGIGGVLYTGVLRDMGEAGDQFSSPSLVVIEGLTETEILANDNVMMFFKAPAKVQYESASSAFIMPGDSGGALLCKEENGEWALLAVNTTFQYFVPQSRLSTTRSTPPQTGLVFMSLSSTLDAPVKQALFGTTEKEEAPTLPEGIYFPRKITTPLIMKALGLDRP